MRWAFFVSARVFKVGFYDWFFNFINFKISVLFDVPYLFFTINNNQKLLTLLIHLLNLQQLF